MTQTFNQDVFIDGAQDITQLRVQGHTTQNQPLQTWENSAGTAQAQVTGDARLQIGDDLATPDALLEAHRAETSTAKPKRGLHSLGKITNLVSDIVSWMVAELELLGTNGVSGLQTTLRAKLTHNNTGTATSADLRAGDFESLNKTGSSGSRVGQVTGVRGTGSNDASAFAAKVVGVGATITNGSGGNITDASGFEVATPSNSGTVTNLYGLRIPDLTQGITNYALHTGSGIVRFGDFLEVKRPTAVPGTPATDFMRVYPKSDGKLYAKNWAGEEFDLTAAGGGGGSVALAGVCNGRLTLSSGESVPITDILAATTLYFTPFKGNQIALFNGGSWGVVPFTERSLSLAGLAANTAYDIFIYDNAGVLTLEAVAWNAPGNGSATSISNATPRVATVPSHALSAGQFVTIAGNSVASNNATWRVGTTTATTFQLLNQDGTNSSAPGSVGSGGTWQRADQNTTRATPLVLQDGVYVKSGALARRYLGTIRTTAVVGQVEDSAKKRFVYNEYNQVSRKLKVVALGVTSWTPVGSTWRPARNYLDYRVEVVVGNVGILANFDVLVRATGGGGGITSGVGYDAITTHISDIFPNLSNDGHISTHARHYPATPGYHFYQWLENARGATSVSIFGIATDGYQSGMIGDITL